MAMNLPMMKPFRLCLIQLGQIGFNKTSNLAHVREMIQRAMRESRDGSQKKVDMVMLPECFNSPYSIKEFQNFAEEVNFDRNNAEAYDTQNSKSQTVRELSRVARENSVWIVGGSIPEQCTREKKIFNTSLVFNSEGNLIQIHRKIHLFDIDIPEKITFKESEILSAGSQVTDFETPFGRIGLGICYDMRFPPLAEIAARKGCIAMLYPGAFNLTTGPLHWELLTRARAVDNQMFVAACSPARDLSASYHAWGHSTIVGPDGRVLSTTDETESIIYADLDPSNLEAMRTGIPLTAQIRHDLYSLCGER